MRLIERINDHMHGPGCPTAGSLGECAAIYQVPTFSGATFFTAELYLWSAASALASREVAGWFKAAGCGDVTVSHMLEDENNGVTNGRAHDGVRNWQVSFSAPAGFLERDLG